jgi:hypothetical protein
MGELERKKDERERRKKEVDRQGHIDIEMYRGK